MRGGEGEVGFWKFPFHFCPAWGAVWNRFGEVPVEIGRNHLAKVLLPISCQGATPLHFPIALADLESGGGVLIVAFSTDKNTSPPSFPFNRVGESGVEIGGGGGGVFCASRQGKSTSPLSVPFVGARCSISDWGDANCSRFCR